MTTAAPSAPPPPLAAATSGRSALWLRLGILGGGLLLATLLAWTVRLPSLPLCGFRAFTGRPCPGCGMTRAVAHLARGDVLASLRYHPLGVVVVALAGSLALGAAAGLVRGEDPVWRLVERRAVIVFPALGGILVALWIVRAFVVPEWAPDAIAP